MTAATLSGAADYTCRNRPEWVHWGDARGGISALWRDHTEAEWAAATRGYNAAFRDDYMRERGRERKERIAELTEQRETISAEIAHLCGII